MSWQQNLAVLCRPCGTGSGSMDDVRLRGSRKASEVRDGVAGLEFLQRGTERLFPEVVKVKPQLQLRSENVGDVRTRSQWLRRAACGVLLIGGDAVCAQVAGWRVGLPSCV